MNYSFWCPRCGFSFMSNNRTEVAQVERLHKKTKWSYMFKLNSCELLPTGNGKTFARPDLARKLQEKP